jgi:dienelactone hydrolase
MSRHVFFKKKSLTAIFILFQISLALFFISCSESSTTPFSFVEEEIAFTSDPNELFGILTIPEKKGPHPAVVLLHGSGRGIGDSPYYKDHSHHMAQSGFTVLRYDSPGKGKSTGNTFGESLEYRTQEAIAAVKYLQSRDDIKTDAVGLWGISQGGWICQMAAAASEEIAFIIPVSGPGVTPAEQEVFRVEMESKAAGFTEEEISKAVLMRRLMVDIFLSEQKYETMNKEESARIGQGPWNDFSALIYNKKPEDSGIELKPIYDILTSIKDENWTRFLHLDEVLPMIENLPQEQWETIKPSYAAMMSHDPADYLSKVSCPVLAIFGEKDKVIPVERSVELYKSYLNKAGNEDVTIKVFSDANHRIFVRGKQAPGYYVTLSEWLSDLAF